MPAGTALHLPSLGNIPRAQLSLISGIPKQLESDLKSMLRQLENRVGPEVLADFESWRSRGEALANSHLVYDMLVGDVGSRRHTSPSSVPLTEESQINRLAHTLSHVAYASTALEEWKKEGQRFWEHMESYAGLTETIERLRHLTEKLNKAVERDNKRIEDAGLGRLDFVTSTAHCAVVDTLEEIVRTLQTQVVTETYRSWRIFDNFGIDAPGAQEEPAERVQIFGVAKDQDEQSWQQELKGTIRDALPPRFKALPPSKCLGILEESQKSQATKDLVAKLKTQVYEPTTSWKSLVRSFVAGEDQVSKQQVEEARETLQKCLSSLMATTSPYAETIAYEMQGDGGSTQDAAAAALSKQMTALAESVETLCKATESFERAREKIRSCSRSDWHLPLDGAVVPDTATDTSMRAT